LDPHVWRTAKKPISAPKVFRVSGDGAQSLGDRAEQNTVDDGVVLRRDGRHLCWQGEHHVEVLRVENLGPAILQPLRAGQ